MSCLYMGGISTIRVTRVDQCGKPIVGATNAVVSECVASLSMNPNIDDGDSVTYKNGAGKLCAYKAPCPQLLSVDVELQINMASPEIIELITGSPVVMDSGGATVGWDDCGITCNSGGYALEAWIETIGDNCVPGATPKWLYVLLPWVVNNRLDDLELAADAVQFQLNGTTRAGGQWGTGPWNVVPGAGGTAGPLLTPLGSGCHRRLQSTTIAPPADSDCAYVAVPATP